MLSGGEHAPQTRVAPRSVTNSVPSLYASFKNSPPANEVKVNGELSRPTSPGLGNLSSLGRSLASRTQSCSGPRLMKRSYRFNSLDSWGKAGTAVSLQKVKPYAR